LHTAPMSADSPSGGDGSGKRQLPERRLPSRKKGRALMTGRRAVVRFAPGIAVGAAVIAGLAAYARSIDPEFAWLPQVVGYSLLTAVSVAALVTGLVAVRLARRSLREVRSQWERIRALALALGPAAAADLTAALEPHPPPGALARHWRAARLRLRRPITATARALPWASVGLVLLVALADWSYNVSAASGPVDDAYIAFRYARNMAQGHVFVWNRGEAPSGGVTCPLFVTFLAGGFLAGLRPEGVAHVLNAAATLGVAACVLAVVGVRRRSPPILASLVLAAFLLDEAVVRHAGLGMETMVNAFALALHLALVVALLRRPRASLAAASALVALAAGLLRPESTVLCGLAYLPLVLKLARAGRWRLIALSAGLYVALGLAYVAWSYTYFGYLLPNAFYLKCVHPRQLVGWPFVRDFLRSRWHVTAMVALGAVALAVRRRWAVLAAGGLPVLFLLGYLSTVIHEMSPQFRYEVPLYTYAVAVAALGLRAVQPRRPRPRALLGVSAAAAACLMALATAPPVPSFGMPMVMFATIGKALGTTGLGHRAVLYTGAAGRLPYESDFWHVDCGAGLVTDALCGRVPLTREERHNYLTRTPPDVRLELLPPAAAGSESYLRDPALGSEYVQQVLREGGRHASVLRRYLMAGTSYTERQSQAWKWMVELRDAYVCLGQYPRVWRGRRRFAYVRRGSPHRAAIERALKRCLVSTPLSRGEPPAQDGGEGSPPDPAAGEPVPPSEPRPDAP
jgi:hypothetical protein